MHYYYKNMIDPFSWNNRESIETTIKLIICKLYQVWSLLINEISLIKGNCQLNYLWCHMLWQWLQLSINASCRPIGSAFHGVQNINSNIWTALGMHDVHIDAGSGSLPTDFQKHNYPSLKKICQCHRQMNYCCKENIYAQNTWNFCQEWITMMSH